MYFVEPILGPNPVIQRQYVKKKKKLYIYTIIKFFKSPYDLYSIHARLHSFIRKNRTQLLQNDNPNIFTKNILSSLLTVRHTQLNSYDMKKYQKNMRNHGCIFKIQEIWNVLNFMFFVEVWNHRRTWTTYWTSYIFFLF